MRCLLFYYLAFLCYNPHHHPPTFIGFVASCNIVLFIVSVIVSVRLTLPISLTPTLTFYIAT